MPSPVTVPQMTARSGPLLRQTYGAVSDSATMTPSLPASRSALADGQRPQIPRQQRQDVPRLQVRQELLEERLVGIRRHGADERLRPGQRLGRIGRHRRQPRRPGPRRAVEVDRQRLPDRLDRVREIGMLPEQHLVSRQRQIRRHAEGGVAPAEDRNAIRHAHPSLASDQPLSIRNERVAMFSAFAHTVNGMAAQSSKRNRVT